MGQFHSVLKNIFLMVFYKHRNIKINVHIKLFNQNNL
jgi:hypothetical protein